MLVTQNRSQQCQKFGAKIPTKLVEDAKSSLRGSGFVEFKNGDVVSTASADGYLVLKKQLPSPDGLTQETAVKLKKAFLGGYKVASAYLGMTHRPHRNGIGLMVKPLGKVDLDTATTETIEFLERII